MSEKTLASLKPRSRALSRTLAQIVQRLQLEDAHLITLAQLQSLCDDLGVRSAGKVVAARLKSNGWLLATGQPGVYEFCPMERGGAISRGDVTLPLQSLLAKRHELRAAVTFQSAAWMHNFADRLPTRLEVATPKSVSRVSVAKEIESELRLSSFTPRLGPQQLRGVPVLAPESILVHMAQSPRDVRSWASAFEWLPELTEAVSLELIKEELEGRHSAIAVRLGYLVQRLRPDIASECSAYIHGRVDFGKRGEKYRFDSTWHIRDSVLPKHPSSFVSLAS